MNKECPLPSLCSYNEFETVRELYQTLECCWRTLGLPGPLREYSCSPPTPRQDAITGTDAKVLKIVRSADLSLQSALYSLEQGLVRDGWQDLGYVTYCVGLINGFHAAQAKDVDIEALLQERVRPPQRDRTLLSEAMRKAIKELTTKEGEVPSRQKMERRFQEGYQPQGMECRYDQENKEYIIEGSRFTPKQFSDAYKSRVRPQKVS